MIIHKQKKTSIRGLATITIMFYSFHARSMTTYIIDVKAKSDRLYFQGHQSHFYYLYPHLYIQNSILTTKNMGEESQLKIACHQLSVNLKLYIAFYTNTNIGRLSFKLFETLNNIVFVMQPKTKRILGTLVNHKSKRKKNHKLHVK